MGDAENALPPSKKRVAGRQLSKDNPEGDDDDDASELETGTFQRASEEVLATRKFVKVRRTQPPPASSSNPFATIRLAPTSDSVAKAASSPVVQSDAVSGETVPEEKDGANEKIENCGTGEGTESGNVVDETNGTEGPGRKLEEATDVSTNKDVEEVKSDTADVSTNNNVDEVKSDAAEKKVENGEDADRKYGRETFHEEENDAEEGTGEAEQTVGGKTEEGTGEAEQTVGGKTEEASDKTVIVGEETNKGTSENGKQDAAKPVASFSSFQHLSSSQNAFTGLSGTGFGTSSFSFGKTVKEGPTFDPGSGSVFAFKSETQSFPSFGSGNNGNFSLQTSGMSTHESGKLPMPVVPVETGEENETGVFTADAILYEYLDGGWKERGKGELKVNTQTSGAQKARLVMRARGNYRLILNANLYPDMTLTNMEKKGVTFACLNNAGDKLKSHELTTFALKFKDSSFVEEFRSVVTEHKGMKETVVKTPENSPKASED